MKEETEHRVLELAALLCDELITADQFAELDEILASDRVARDAYRGFLALHQRLQDGALEANRAAARATLSIAKPEPASGSVFRAIGTAPGLAPLNPARPAETNLESRVRKAERRAMWSMVACFVVTLFLIALLFRPKMEQRAEKSWMKAESNGKVKADDRGPEGRPENVPTEEVRARIATLSNTPPTPTPTPPPAPDVPPPPPPPSFPPPAAGKGALAGTVADSGQVEEATGGFILKEAAINDVFQMLAKRAGKQYLHNSKVSGPDFKVSGHLNDGNPMQQMEELAFAQGLSLHQKGDTVYALNKEQMDQLPAEKLRYPLRYIRPDDIDQVKELIQPLLSPTGIASVEPGSNTVTIVDSSPVLDKALDLLAKVDGARGGAQAPASPQPGSPLASAPRRDAIGGGTPSRGDHERRNAAFEPLSSPGEDPVALAPGQIAGVPRASESGGLVTQPSSPTEIAEEGEEATISLIDRVPLITTNVAQTEVSNQVTEEVRYSIDQKDPVGNPATTREIGVQVAVTPSLLSDGTIQMKMRPLSAQIVEDVVSQSGNRYPQVSESMLESIARIPDGHSVVLGGFYGQGKAKDGNKVPLLGDTPQVGLFFKGKETAKEPPSLLFVATPTAHGDQVVTEMKILSVNSNVAEQTGGDWNTSLGKAGVPLEAIGSLNSLFGINKVTEMTSDATAGNAGPIVLSPEQVEEVLRTLSAAGLVTQTSNPTLVTELNEAEAAKRERHARGDLEKSAGDEPYSTFSLNVSDVSFKLARAVLGRGTWPEVDQIRVEEFVNAFDYGDPAPSQKEKVACKLEQAAHPFLQQRNLLRVSMKTAALGRAAETPLRLTVLLDNSGSMERADRAESVKRAFQLLAGQLTPRDQVTLIGFARTPRLLADRLAGDKVAELVGVVESMPIEGGTNLEQALALGIAKAKEQMLAGGQNRIILMTDGAANLGNAAPEDLARLVETMRQQGIAFDACGVGADGLNDEVLEALTRKGDGRYYVLDQPEDADEGFARQIAGALRPAARNVKVQVNFNPNRVGRYKLYGFEKHRLKKEDFRNDSVDAAELAAEEAGNALYQVEVLPEGRGEIGTVSVRFEDTASGRMVERKWTIPYEGQVPRLEDAAASLRLASGAALLAEKLRGSAIGESVEMGRLGNLMTSLISDFPSDQRVRELVEMTRKVRELRGE